MFQLKDTKQLSSTKPNNSMELEGKISAALKSITQALQVRLFLKLKLLLSTVNQPGTIQYW